MKKLIVAAMAALALAGCSSNITQEGHTYEPYGLLNPEQKNPNVCYDTNKMDVVLGIIFFESVIVPIYVFGFDYKEPRQLKDKNGNC